MSLSEMVMWLFRLFDTQSQPTEAWSEPNFEFLVFYKSWLGVSIPISTNIGCHKWFASIYIFTSLVRGKRWTLVNLMCLQAEEMWTLNNSGVCLQREEGYDKQWHIFATWRRNIWMDRSLGWSLPAGSMSINLQKISFSILFFLC